VMRYSDLAGKLGGEEVWYCVNVADLTKVPGIEQVAVFLLPPRWSAELIPLGPEVDDVYICWRMERGRAEGIDHVLKTKLPGIRTRILTHPPKPYKR